MKLMILGNLLRWDEPYRHIPVAGLWQGKRKPLERVNVRRRVFERYHWINNERVLPLDEIGRRRRTYETSIGIVGDQKVPTLAFEIFSDVFLPVTNRV
jgi:hypothetical protein